MLLGYINTPCPNISLKSVARIFSPTRGRKVTRNSWAWFKGRGVFFIPAKTLLLVLLWGGEIGQLIISWRRGISDELFANIKAVAAAAAALRSQDNRGYLKAGRYIRSLPYRSGAQINIANTGLFNLAVTRWIFPNHLVGICRSRS